MSRSRLESCCLFSLIRSLPLYKDNAYFYSELSAHVNPPLNPLVYVRCNKQNRASIKELLKRITANAGWVRENDGFMENIYLEGDQVILLSVVEQSHLPFLADAMVIEEWKHEVHKMQGELKALERKYIDRCSDLRIPIRFWVEQGKPGEKICEIALKEKATLIVLGSQSSGLLRRTVLGSVSNYVIHHTKIPVVLCPKDPL